MRSFATTASFVFILSLQCIAQKDIARPGSIGVTISLPWANNYSYYDHDLKTASSKSGFIGFGGSVFYKRSKNKISVNFGITGDLPAPIGPLDYGHEGTRTNTSSLFVEIINHRSVYRKLNIIGGLNYVDYLFNFTSYVDTIPSYKKNDRTIGLTVGAEYSFSKVFSLAIFYRPALVSFGIKQYRHLISLDARFNINVINK